MVIRKPNAADRPAGRLFRRPGNVAVWVLVCLGVLLGVLALGMDGGRLMEERRRDQSAADAAALAAADDLYLNYQQNQGADPNGTAKTAALASAQANGYANDGVSSTVTVNIPPQSGAFAGQANYVEVVIQSNLQGSFSAFFTQGPLPVRARSVARGRVLNVGLLLLQPSGGDSLSASGNAGVQVVNGPVVIDSSSPLAYDLSGNSSISAAYSDVAGDTAPTGNILGPINTSVPPTADPLAALPAPNPADYPVRAASQTSISSGSVTLQPGVYEGGISVSGQAALTLTPGVYVLDGGGFQVSGNATATGDGVMLYNTGGSLAGSINVSGDGQVNLSPPTGGVYQGISLFQDRTVSQTIQISGNGAVQITGMVYAPAATVQLSGNGGAGGDTLGGGYVVSQMAISGNADFRIKQGSSRPRIPDVGLVE